MPAAQPFDHAIQRIELVEVGNSRMKVMYISHQLSPVHAGESLVISSKRQCPLIG